MDTSYCQYILQDYPTLSRHDVLLHNHRSMNLHWSVGINTKLTFASKWLCDFEWYTSIVWPIFWRSWHFAASLGCRPFVLFQEYACYCIDGFQDWLKKRWLFLWCWILKLVFCATATVMVEGDFSRFWSLRKSS